MRKKKMVGIARVVLQRRERILMIEPLAKGLLATSLRYGNEIRQADAYFEDVPDNYLILLAHRRGFEP
jgi:DNA end-binding protein Ku